MKNSIKACSKRYYQTRKEAKKMLKYLKIKKKIKRKDGDVYRCDQCRGWHITSQNRSYRRDLHERLELQNKQS